MGQPKRDALFLPFHLPVVFSTLQLISNRGTESGEYDSVQIYDFRPVLFEKESIYV